MAFLRHIFLLVVGLVANGHFIPSGFSSGNFWNDDDSLDDDHRSYGYENSYEKGFGFEQNFQRPQFGFSPHYPAYPPFPYLHFVRYLPNQNIPIIVRLPNSQTIILPVRSVYSFPSFIERLIQRIQDYYSVFTPLEILFINRGNETSTSTTPTTPTNLTTEAAGMTRPSAAANVTTVTPSTTASGSEATTSSSEATTTAATTTAAAA